MTWLIDINWNFTTDTTYKVVGMITQGGQGLCCVYLNPTNGYVHSIWNHDEWILTKFYYKLCK